MAGASADTVHVVLDRGRELQRPGWGRANRAELPRLAPGLEVDRLLATVMDSDSSPLIRSDGYLAARFPPPAALADAVLHTASSDSVDYVPSDAVALIRQNPSASPNIPDTLEYIANRDLYTLALCANRNGGAQTMLGPLNLTE